MEIKKLMASLDYPGLRKLLSENPSLANQGIPFDEVNGALAHPLHRICDGVFAGTYSDVRGTEIARIFLEHGSNIDGFGLVEKKDTPLIAAASLNAEEVGILYISSGANVHHAGTHGGTALHWAAWLGKAKLVDALIKAGADVHKQCIDFKSTPLFWAIHGQKFQGGQNRHHQTACVGLLLDAGAEKNVYNREGTKAIDLLTDEDTELKALLS